MANRSRCILQKELREQIAPVALLERSDERANRSFTKEQWERMSSLRVTGAILYERVIRFFKEWFASNPIFSLFYAQTKRANHSRLSFKNSDECESLLLLFTERSKRANHSVTLYKKSHESDLHFEKSDSHFRSQKTLDSYEKPKSDFPTLLQDDKLHCVACQCWYCNTVESNCF